MPALNILLRYALPMASEVRKLDVLIASPGDAASSRDAIEKALHGWNDHRSVAEGIMLRPRRWETGSVPILGQGDAQSIINSQLVDESDIVFAVFNHRLGSPTGRAVSGTVEEIDRCVSHGKPVHLYFAEASLPYDADLDQFKALRDFRAEMQQRGLVATFNSDAELAQAVRDAIEYDIARRVGQADAVVIAESPPHVPVDHGPAEPSNDLQFVMASFPPGRTQLVVDNTKYEAVDDVRISITNGAGVRVRLHGPRTIQRRDGASYEVCQSIRDGEQYTILATWTGMDGRLFEHAWTDVCRRST